MTVDRFCASAYLTFRYVPDASAEWIPGARPGVPELHAEEQIPVATADGIMDSLRRVIDHTQGEEQVGLLLSAGMDSAILAALMPPGTLVYTIRFDATGAIDESPQAAQYAQRWGHRHRVITVTWADYLGCMDRLMVRKRSPLHPVEPALATAARIAREDGITRFVLGIGADSTFGGLDKLLSRDWSYDAFRRRYTFLDPAIALTDPVDVEPVFHPYKRGEGVDVLGFLKVVHGLGIVQAFENAFAAQGAQTLCPFEALRLDGPLDLERVRRGDSKYLLREVFRRLYGADPVEKIPFARPMDVWLGSYGGPRHPDFRRDFELEGLTGDQRWLIYCLDRFMSLVDGGNVAG